ncbi:MAG: formate dehydrogenase [Rubrivivax sp.]|jgi:hypothetical protein|nr:formate dehydrogenase [Rubrivivax sp.]
MKEPSSPVLGRRTVFAGAGAVGALAVAATVLPGSPAGTPAPTADAAPDRSAGYRLTEHVKRYYASART